MGFRKAFKKLRKGLGIPALTLGNAAKVGAVAALGGTPALAAAAIKSKLKSAGSTASKIIRTKAEKALAKKVLGQRPNVDRTMVASTMPGGAPIAGRASPRRARMGVTRKAAAAAVKKSVKKATGGKRTAPRGGKDLKALSASWKAAGKPGSWMAWVKSH